MARKTTADVRVWVMDGCRPSYDSPPMCHGTQMTEGEFSTLRSIISRYYSKCQERREKEAAQWRGVTPGMSPRMPA